MVKIFFIHRVKFFFLIVGAFCCMPNYGFATSTDPVMPSAIIKLPENEKAILVEKKTQTLFVYSNKKDLLTLLFQVPCSTGEVDGVKQKAGDKKTPEGIYFLKDEYVDKYLSPVYGKKAFPTDYPNLLDKRSGKNGSAIWIHGTNKKLVPMDSNGCVALENINVLKLSDYVTLDSTPVIMVEQVKEANTSLRSAQEQQITLFLDKWSSALEQGSYHDYLSFFASEYFPDISWWEDWLDLRKEIGKSGTFVEIVKERTGIYSHDQVFVVIFDSFLSVDKRKVYLGKQKLFLKNKDGKYKIVGDIFQQIPNELKANEGLLVTAAKSLVTPAWQEKLIVETLGKWLAAWSAKDMDAYASFYAPNFYSDGMGKKSWVRRKKNLARKYNFIHVTGRDFIVEKGKDVCVVIFFQEYESSGLTTMGTKKLKLVNKGGLWKIFQESWKEK